VVDAEGGASDSPDDEGGGGSARESKEVPLVAQAPSSMVTSSSLQVVRAEGTRKKEQT
jgi:hypothetical protein